MNFAWRPLGKNFANVANSLKHSRKRNKKLRRSSTKQKDIKDIKRR